MYVLGALLNMEHERPPCYGALLPPSFSDFHLGSSPVYLTSGGFHVPWTLRAQTELARAEAAHDARSGASALQESDIGGSSGVKSPGPAFRGARPSLPSTQIVDMAALPYQYSGARM